jgi:hypothetical protein
MVTKTKSLTKSKSSLKTVVKKTKSSTLVKTKSKTIAKKTKSKTIAKKTSTLVKKPSTVKTSSLVKNPSTVKTSSLVKNPSISLLEHQIKPIQYLVARCKDQHGLLINHMFGTGKTNVGLFLAKNYPKNNVVLICPRGLDAQWLNQAKIIGVKINLVLFYDELSPENLSKKEKFIKDSIIIMDECHNLIPILESISKGEKIGEDDTEGGDEDEEEPKQLKRGEKEKIKNKKVKKEAKNALIHTLDVFKSAKKVLLMSGTPIRDNIRDLRWLVNIAAGKRVFPYNCKEFEEQYFYKNPIKSFLYGWIDPLLRIKDPYSGTYLIKDDKYDFQFKDLNYFSQEKVATVLFGVFSLFKFDVNSKLLGNGLIETLYNTFKGTGNRTDFMKWASCAIILYFGFQLVLKAKSHLIDKYDFEKLNLERIKIASPYISYYKYDNLDYYPETKICNKKISYTDYQLSLFVRLTTNISITDKESVELEYNESLDEAELYKPTSLNYTNLLDKGRKIGNLTGINPVTNEIDYPTKFLKIIEIYKRNPLQTLIYSNFSNSLYDLQDFLKKRNINVSYYHPKLSVAERNKMKEDFNNEKIKVLLIHPNYFEGFDVKGVRIFHVLEPVNEYFKREQLYARPVRYLSHAHLPKSQRNVTIVQWKCSISSIFDKIQKEKSQFSNWFKGDKENIYFKRMNDVSNDYTPDETIFNHINSIASKIEDIQDKMKTIRIDDKKDIEVLCNIYGIPNSKKNLPNCYK